MKKRPLILGLLTAIIVATVVVVCVRLFREPSGSSTSRLSNNNNDNDALASETISSPSRAPSPTPTARSTSTPTTLPAAPNTPTTLTPTKQESLKPTSPTASHNGSTPNPTNMPSIQPALTQQPTTSSPSTASPFSVAPATASPTQVPTSQEQPDSLTPSLSVATTIPTPLFTSIRPSTSTPTTRFPTLQPTTNMPTSGSPTTRIPTSQPTTVPTTMVPSKAPQNGNTNQPQEHTSLLECLQLIPDMERIVLPSSGDYQAARQCLVWEPSQNPNGNDNAIIAKPATTQATAAVVACAAQYGNTRVSARSGAHGFTAQACAGQIILDMSRHDSVTLLVDNDGSSTRQLVQFGAGQLHGQLYARLDREYGLVVPGGTEAMVGVGGLWLGCGRGLLTQLHGFSCDQVVAIEYVDGTGTIRTANDTTETDMFWMSRGSGGLFPGVVTKFTARVFPKPPQVLEAFCYLPLASLEDAIVIWLQFLDDYNNFSRKIFSDLTADRNAVRIEWNCWGCDQAESSIYEQIKETTKSQLAAILPGGIQALNCDNSGITATYTWEEKLLSRSWDTYYSPEDLVVRPEWPEWLASSGENLAGTGLNGGFLVPNDYQISRDLVNTLAGYLRASPGESWDRASRDSLLLYPMSRNNAGSSSAYGGRDAKLVIHYKHDRIDEAAGALYQSHVSALENTLVEQHGLPCRGFYNYGDTGMACATTDDEWLGAFFSDPLRIRTILQQQDPNGVFYRERLQ